MAPPIDQDWEYLDRVISLALDIVQQANEVKEFSDDPEVLYASLKQEAAGLLIQKLSREYRPRLRRLKESETARSGKRAASRDKELG